MLAQLVFFVTACAHKQVAGPAQRPIRSRENISASGLSPAAVAGEKAAVKSEKNKLKQTVTRVDRALIRAQSEPRFISSEAYYYAMRGQIERDAGACKRSVAAFQQALSYDPDSVYLRVESARCLLRQGAVQAAIEQARRALQVPGLHLQARLLLTQALLRARDAAAAAQVIEPLLNKKPMPVEAVYWGVIVSLRRERPASARALLKKFSLQQGPRPEALSELAARLIDSAETTTALEAYALALQIDPEYAAALRGQRDAAERLGQIKLAWKAAHKLAQTAPLGSDTSLQMLRICARLRQTKNALLTTSDCKKMPQKISADLQSIQDEELRLRIARSVFTGGDSDWARALLLPLLRRHKALPADAALLLSRIAAQRADLSQALKLLRRANRQVQRSVPFRQQRARLLWRLNRYGQALGVLRRSLKENPDALPLRFQLVELLDRNGDFAAAQKLLDQLGDDEKKGFDFVYQQALLWVDAGQPTRAFALVQKTNTATPDNVQGLLLLALVAMQAGELQRAEGAALQVLAIAPQRVEAKNFLAYIWAVQNKNLDAGLRYVDQALLVQADDAAMLDTRAYLLFRQGHLDAAQKILSRVESRQKDDAEILTHLGEIAQAQGRSNKARACWHRALQLKPRSRLLRKRLRQLLAALAKDRA